MSLLCNVFQRAINRPIPRYQEFAQHTINNQPHEGRSTWPLCSVGKGQTICSHFPLIRAIRRQITLLIRQGFGEGIGGVGWGGVLSLIVFRPLSQNPGFYFVLIVLPSLSRVDAVSFIENYTNRHRSYSSLLEIWGTGKWRRVGGGGGEEWGKNTQYR